MEPCQKAELAKIVGADNLQLTDQMGYVSPSVNVDDECIECGEVAGGLEPTEPCPNSQRQCGHHCNCIWIHDRCHWCPAEIDDQGNLITPAREES